MNFLKLLVIDSFRQDDVIHKEEAIINLDTIDYISSTYNYGSTPFYKIVFNNNSSILIDKETYDAFSNKIIQTTLAN